MREPRSSRLERALRARATLIQRSLVVAVISVCTTGATAGIVQENHLKAAIVSRLPDFVNWPDDAADRPRTIDICVAASDPFASDLEEVVRSENVNDRALALRRIDVPTQVPDCHVLFLSPASVAYRTFLATAVSRPVLTVSDDPGFLDAGGIVALRVVEGRIRFEVNDAAARRVGLRVSSHLLRLALSRPPATQ